MTGRSRDEVDETLGSQLIRAFALNLPATEWARHGGRHPFGDDFTGGQDIIPQTLDEETVVAATKDIPDSLLRQSLLTARPTRWWIRRRDCVTAACATRCCAT